MEGNFSRPQAAMCYAQLKCTARQQPVNLCEAGTQPHPTPTLVPISSAPPHLTLQNSAPNPPHRVPTRVTPPPRACSPHANPALHFLPPPTPFEQRATPPLTRPAHPCYAFPNKGPTCHQPTSPTPAATCGSRTCYRASRRLQPGPGGLPFCHGMSPKSRSQTHHPVYPGTAPQLRNAQH